MDGKKAPDDYYTKLIVERLFFLVILFLENL